MLIYCKFIVFNSKKVFFNRIILFLTILSENPSYFIISQSILIILAIFLLLKIKVKSEIISAILSLNFIFGKDDFFYNKFKRLNCFFAHVLTLKKID